MERVDIDLNGQVDAIKLTFNQAIKDSTIDVLSNWVIGGFVQSTYAIGSGIAGDGVDDDVVYITFTEDGTLMSAAPFNVNTSNEHVSSKDGLTGANQLWNANTTD